MYFIKMQVINNLQIQKYAHHNNIYFLIIVFETSKRLTQWWHSITCKLLLHCSTLFSPKNKTPAKQNIPVVVERTTDVKNEHFCSESDQKITSKANSVLFQTEAHTRNSLHKMDSIWNKREIVLDWSKKMG